MHIFDINDKQNFYINYILQSTNVQECLTMMQIKYALETTKIYKL